MGNDSVYIFYVIILAIVGIATLVRKAVEKASSGEKGKKINLAQVVQRELRKYMGGPEPARSDPPVAPTAPRTEARPVVPALVLAPPRPPQSSVGEVTPVRRLVERPKSLETSRAALTATQRAEAAEFAPGLDRKSVKRGIVMAEVLGPAMALREDYRLF